MTKTANRRRKVLMPNSISKKLVAAVCMLLVSSIMLVSTTYAWFTLSTAPEVTGITTNVGANGNLEIALLNKDSYVSTADDLGILSNVGDSMVVKAATEANETWGNLVDLSDSTYGLTQMILNPAALNINADGTLVGPTMLYAPSYGSDGRVIDVHNATYPGKFAAVGNKFVMDDAHAGIRALGTTTDVTQAVAAYRAAKADITIKMNLAREKAAKSLLDNGQHLANIMVGHVQNADTKVTAEQKAALDAMVAALKEANTAAGDAIKAAVLANSLSAGGTLTDEQVTALVNAVNSADLATVDFTTIENVTVPAGYDAALATWTANNTKLTEAETGLTGLTAEADGTYAYTAIEPHLNKLVYREFVEICGIVNPTRANVNDIVNYFTANQIIPITMKDGSGVYADIAKLVGDYTASGLTVSLEVSGMGTISAPVTMNTAVATSDNSQVKQITVGNAPTGGTVTSATLSDTYGYAIDFGFRTNAAGSNLQLQTAAVNRVYEENGSNVTQGSGSFMEFTTNNPTTFTVDEVRALMSAIRVVFVTPAGDGSGYTVLGIAAADITKNVAADTGIVTYTGGTVTGDTLKAELYLYNYTVREITADEHQVVLGEKKADETALTALAQNVAKKVSAIVYLDGDLVDNTMVANAQTSMTGGLNLQFSSSADLVPMQNSGLQNAEEGEVEYTQVAAPGATYTFAGQTATVKEGYTIYRGNNGKVYYSTDGATYTELTAANYSTALTLTTPETP